MPTGAERIAAEREAHRTREGWTQARDAKYPPGELAKAGRCYAGHAAAALRMWGDPASWSLEAAKVYRAAEPPEGWPWDLVWWKPRDPMRDLERAGALIAAEMDRIDYRANQPAKPAPDHFGDATEMVRS